MSRGSLLLSDNRGFSVFALDSPQALRTIRTKLERIKAGHFEDLLLAADWPDFRRRVGVIEGLNQALHVCDEIEQAERA